jgi:hypothetical protein
VLALLGILVNVTYFVVINSRLGALEVRFDGRIDRLETKFELLTGKVVDVDNRLSRIEEQLRHSR